MVGTAIPSLAKADEMADDMEAGMEGDVEVLTMAVADLADAAFRSAVRSWELLATKGCTGTTADC